MCCRDEKKKRIWMFGCGVFFASCAVTLALVWPSLSLQLIYKQFVLKPGTINYESWLETPIPMYLELYLFNWTNPEEVHNHKTVKPHFEELGPYVFLEKHKRVNIVMHDNSTVTFNQVRTWQFVPSMTKGSLDDKVTNLNVVAATVGFTVRKKNPVIRMFTNYLLKRFDTQLTITKSVRELLFDGYQDPIIDFMKTINSTAFNVPFSKFGWFVERNNSETYDGQFTMHTGVDDIHQLGILQLWNGSPRSPYYRDECGMINGTTGEVWPPLTEVGNRDVTVFASDVCRSISLGYQGETEKFGLPGHRWVGDSRPFDNGFNYPETACFCTGATSECNDLMPGVLNVSDCRFGAPAFVSYPHFYLADKSYLEPLTGLTPNRTEHEFYMALEPTTGIPLEVRAQLQINILLEPIGELSIYKDVPTMMVPTIWFRQVASITEDLASDAKMALLVPKIGLYVAYGCAAIAAILILIPVAMIITKKLRRHDDEMEILR